MLSEVWSDLRYRLRALFRREAMERELEAELAYHIERETEKYVAMGIPPEEARRRARLAFGGVEGMKEASRDVRGTVLLEALIRDVRYGARSLRRSPGFALTAILCLALGIGATSTVFGIIDALYLRPPPGVGDPAGIVRPYITAKGSHLTMNASEALSYPAYVELRDHTRTLSGLAGYSPVPVDIGSGQDVRREDGFLVSGNYFSVLRVRPALGRFFTPDEDAGPGSPQVAVLSWAYWRGALGGRPDVVGRRLLVDGSAYTVVGVAPAGFEGLEPGGPALWIPISQSSRLAPGADALQRFQTIWFMTVGRLAPGFDRAAAQAELAPMISRELREAWGADVETRVALGPALSARGPTPSSQATIARWLALAAVLLLAIACANTTNLLLARAVTRRKELAVRLSLGASQGRLVRQLLMESVLLAAGGAAVGLVIARWGTALVPVVGLTSLASFAPWRTVVFAVAVALGCATLLGLFPAFSSARSDLTVAVKEGARDGVDRRSRVRRALMVVQAALATLLLIGAGLFVHSLRNVQSIRPGMDVDRMLVARLDLSRAGYDDTAAAAFFDRALERLRLVHGVDAVTLASSTPLAGGWSMTAYSVPGGVSAGVSADIDMRESSQRAIMLRVGTDYFATVGTPILAGRDFTESDRDGAPAIIVNRAFAEHEWPGRSALGRCVVIGRGEDATCYRVVGVVANARYVSLETPPRMAFFLPIERDPRWQRLLLLRVQGDPLAPVAAVRGALAQLDDDVPYVEIRPLVDVLRPVLQPRRLAASMFGAFGLFSLLLAAVGLYGVVSYSVAQRTHELGIRIALGARGDQVRRSVLGQGLRLVVAGLLIGSLGALVGTRFVGHLLYGVPATDPVTFLGVALVLGATALIASAVPAERALRVDPRVALRAE